MACETSTNSTTLLRFIDRFMPQHLCFAEDYFMVVENVFNADIGHADFQVKWLLSIYRLASTDRF